MILVGLTGGIGSGKSTVSTGLARLGAVVIDADRITREVQEPGTPVFEAMVERFGPGIVAPDGTLDRQAVADIVFEDEEELTALNEIVHPAVGVELGRQLAEVTGTDHVVVLDVPLLVESGRTDMSGLLVVDVDPEVAVERLVADRGFSAEDARARMRHQVSREERLAVAYRVIDNSGSLVDLEAEVGRAWDWMRSLDHVPDQPGREEA